MKGSLRFFFMYVIVLLAFVLFSGKSYAKYTDVDEDHWGHGILDSLSETGYIKGYPDGSFKPNNFITRSQGVMIVGRVLGVKPVVVQSKTFSDVSVQSESYPYIEYLVDKGVLSKSTKFNPNSFMTRGQVSKILVESFDLVGYSDKVFKDVPKSSWDHDYINILYSNGITTGTSDTTFDPGGQVTRLQLSAFVSRILEKGLNKTETEPELESTIETYSDIDVSLFTDIMTRNGKSPRVVLNRNISSISNFISVVEEAYETLPDRINLSTNLSYEVLDEEFSTWYSNTHPLESINLHTLANYSLKKTGNSIYLEDTTHKSYSALDISVGLKDFSSIFSSTLTDLSDVEKFNIIYDFVYDNFTYNARGYSFMKVGNMGTGSFACNGYSRLVYDLLNASGIETSIILGEDHIWNRVFIEDFGEFDVDITSDAYLKDKYVTLGTSSSRHSDILNRISFYGSKFNQSKYTHVSDLSEDKLNLLKQN